MQKQHIKVRVSIVKGIIARAALTDGSAANRLAQVFDVEIWIKLRRDAS
jgi:hypothetical protein